MSFLTIIVKWKHPLWSNNFMCTSLYVSALGDEHPFQKKKPLIKTTCDAKINLFLSKDACLQMLPLNTKSNSDFTGV